MTKSKTTTYNGLAHTVGWKIQNSSTQIVDMHHQMLSSPLCYSYDDMPHFRASLPPGDTPNLCCYSNYSHRGAGLPVAEPSTT